MMIQTRPRRGLFLSLISVFLLCGPAAALAVTFVDWDLVAGTAAPPDISAQSAVLLDLNSGMVLYSRDPHRVFPAASLTKVVAIHAALSASDAGHYDLDEPFSPSPRSWAQNQPPGSSLMFLGPAQVLTGNDLLLGLAVSSGNDAALALAEQVDGTVEAFAGRMNRIVDRLGLVSSRFVEPSGLDPRNRTTAAEFAGFLAEHLATYPQLTADLYSRAEFTYPGSEHQTGTEPAVSISQNNRNLLLGSYAGADGVKTGFIDESGYHLAATASRGDRRLVAVVLGVFARTHPEGGRLRAADARALLDYGFDRFETLEFGRPDLSPVRVFKGALSTATPRADDRIVVSVPTGSLGRLSGEVAQVTEIVAPVPGGAEVGSVTVKLDSVILAQRAVTLARIGPGNLPRRVWDSVVLFFRALFGREEPMTFP